MISRKIGNLVWNVVSPSEYTVQGYDAIRAKFNGKKWHLVGAWSGPNTFDTMQHLVQDLDAYVQTVAKEFEQHGYC